MRAWPWHRRRSATALTNNNNVKSQSNSQAFEWMESLERTSRGAAQAIVGEEQGREPGEVREQAIPDGSDLVVAQVPAIEKEILRLRRSKMIVYCSKRLFALLNRELRKTARNWWSNFAHEAETQQHIGLARGVKGANPPKKILALLVVLCFERQCPKPNTVARLKSKYFGPSQNFGLAMPLQQMLKETFPAAASESCQSHEKIRVDDLLRYWS